jgi:8-oxo-dGTP pyrophosphatase MutT (NUDIX family)
VLILPLLTPTDVVMIRNYRFSVGSELLELPAGTLEPPEPPLACAARELEEETGLVAEVGDVVWVASNFHDPAKLTVGVWFAGTVTGGTLQPGDDADDAGFFDLDALPDLAFETDAELLATLRRRGATARAGCR